MLRHTLAAGALVASALVIPGALALNSAAASTTTPAVVSVSSVPGTGLQAPCRGKNCKNKSGHKNKKNKKNKHSSGKHKKHNGKHKKHSSGKHKKHSSGKHKKHSSKHGSSKHGR
ncbi:hypothetical protein [Sphaerisporangium aureirubrum]|uniref:Uncharacterized protein n=1 Tax=Sphaerisporangium aureirubrum TaxID=1544736 RepID=A0ABW1NQY7_9ACTN